MNMSVRDVIIIGAGPSGLSAAIAAKQRDLDYLVLEQGVLVNSIYRFPPQMVFFTTPELLEIGGLPFMSPFDKPTRAEALNYYRKVVNAFDLQISYGEKVLSVEREDGVFVIETATSSGGRRARQARHVVMAIGYYDHPVMIRRAGRGAAARAPFLRRSAPALSPARRHRRRRELGGGVGAGDVSRGRARHGRAPRAGAEVHDQVLGAARHREPDQGGLDRRPVRHDREGDPREFNRAGALPRRQRRGRSASLSGERTGRGAARPTPSIC